MSNKVKESKFSGATIKSEVSEDGKDVLIRIRFDKQLNSYQQLSYILQRFLSVAEFKYIDKDKDTPIQ